MTREQRGAEPAGEGGVDRRGLLRIGGLTMGLAAITAACVNQRESEQVTQTGSRIPVTTSAVKPFPGSAELDASLVLTALSVERLAVETFESVLKEGWLATASTAELARTVQDRHRRHEDALAAQAGALGQDPGRVTPNSHVKENLVDSELEAVRAAETPTERELEAIKLLGSVEEALSQLYARAGGLMTAAALRQSMGRIGAASARYLTALAAPAGQAQVSMAFMPNAPTAIPEDAYVSARA